MLQQILKDGYIEPDLLAELSEDQQQVLFLKMRQEQLRRWNEREKTAKGENAKNSRQEAKKGKKKNVGFRLDRDGKPWTWVMGDHKDDKPYDQLIDDIQLERARKLAEEEAAAQRIKEEQERMAKVRKEEERLARERSRLEEERRKKEQERERELYAALKERKREAERIQQEKLEKERQMREILERDKKIKEERDKHEQEIRKLEMERAKELYQKWKRQAALGSQAEEKETKQQDELWKVQLRRSKKADKERSAAAQRARASLRMSGDYTGLNFADVAQQIHKQNIEQKLDGTNMSSENANGTKPALPPKPKHGPRYKYEVRPKCRYDVVQWMRDVEIPKGVGVDPTTNKVAPWFHGIIPRQDAEEMLCDKHVGTFLLRVSERIWGYAISFMDADRIKHFLIDTSDDTYQFFGASQISHNSLYDLVMYHKDKPISEVGQEHLRIPCGQKSNPPDYADFLDPNATHSTKL